MSISHFRSVILANIRVHIFTAFCIFNNIILAENRFFSLQQINQLDISIPLCFCVGIRTSRMKMEICHTIS